MAEAPTGPGEAPAASTLRMPIEAFLRLAIAALVLYFAASVVLPFLWILTGSVILAVMMYPLFEWLRDHTGAARLSAALVTVVSLVLVLGPIAVLCTNLVSSLRQLVTVVSSGTFSVPALPERIATLPVVGDALVDVWTLGGSNLVDLLETHAHTLVVPGEWLLGVLAKLAGIVLILSAAVLVAGFLFVPGRCAVQLLHTLAERLAGDRGARFLEISGSTIRSVGRGVVGIALLQSLLLGGVLVAVGVPHAGLLTFLALVLSIVQVGAIYVALPATVWVWLSHSPSEAVLVTAIVIAISALEHFVKPIVMGRGLEFPTLLLFLGLIGGMTVYGLAGIFIGPVLLAVAYELFRTWVDQSRPASHAVADAPTAPAPPLAAETVG